MESISEDPIGFAAGDTNTQRYTGNDPVSFRDPSGLAPPPKPTFADVLDGKYIDADHESGDALNLPMTNLGNVVPLHQQGQFGTFPPSPTEGDDLVEIAIVHGTDRGNPDHPEVANGQSFLRAANSYDYIVNADSVAEAVDILRRRGYIGMIDVLAIFDHGDELGQTFGPFRIVGDRTIHPYMVRAEFEQLRQFFRTEDSLLFLGGCEVGDGLPMCQRVSDIVGQPVIAPAGQVGYSPFELHGYPNSYLPRPDDYLLFRPNR